MCNIWANHNIGYEQIKIDEHSQNNQEVKNNNNAQDKDIPEWVGRLLDNMKEKQGGE